MKSNICSQYRLNNLDRVLQGDIFKNFELPTYDIQMESVEIKILQYCVVVSQDCDLDQDFNQRIAFKEKYGDVENLNDKDIDGFRKYHDKFLPNILVVEGFVADSLRTGNQLSDLNLFMDDKGSEKRTPWKKIIQNETPRYHYLHPSKNPVLSDLVFDFKRYYSVPREYFYEKRSNFYKISLNELYREDLSQRFSNYLSRVGLPDIKNFID